MENDLFLTLEDLFQLNCLLTRVVDISRTDCIMLINKSGRMLTAQGETSEFDKTSLSALISGYFASSNSIAHILGEEAFTGMIQEGEKKHIYVSHVDTNTIIACIFDKRSNCDKVKSTVHKFNPQLVKHLELLYKGIETDTEVNIDVAVPEVKKNPAPETKAP